MIDTDYIKENWHLLEEETQKMIIRVDDDFKDKKLSSKSQRKAAEKELQNYKENITAKDLAEKYSTAAIEHALVLQELIRKRKDTAEQLARKYSRSELKKALSIKKINP